jgi:hypothetical protein
MNVPANPIGYLELEMVKQGDGSLSLLGSGFENDFVKVKLPILQKVDRCEKTATGWRGFAGKTR